MGLDLERIKALSRSMDHVKPITAEQAEVLARLTRPRRREVVRTEPFLFTCSYRDFDPSMGTPVRTSNGRPRWSLHYEIEHVCHELMPDRIWMNQPTAEFDLRYTARLNEIGADDLLRRFEQIASEAGSKRLVLLCFENLETGKECHRRTFAKWWLETTGQVVPEMGGLPIPFSPGSPSAR